MEGSQQLDLVMLLLLAGIILSVILAWVSLRVAPEVGLMDVPGSAEHKNHSVPVPLTGGLVLIDTLIVLVIITGLWKVPDIWALSLAGLTIGIFGLLDDFLHLSPLKKMIGQLIGSVILIYFGIQVNIFNSPEFLFRTDSSLDMWLNLGFTILWLVTITNAFNFIDSFDGLAVGLSGLSSAFFLVITLVTGQETLTLFCAMLLGICIGLYFFNAHPASLFLGDSGAQTLGFLLAAVAIIYKPNSGIQSSTWFVPILIFYVPLFDLMLVVLSRLKRNRQVHKASVDHTYHRLADRGIPVHHAVLVMHGVSLIMSMVGYLCLSLPTIYANIVLCLAIFFGMAAYLELDRNYP